MKFNDIIRNAMQSVGITQQDLGEKLGVRQNAIANTIARPGITLTKFVAVMNILGYDIIVQPRDGNGEKMTLTTKGE